MQTQLYPKYQLFYNTFLSLQRYNLNFDFYRTMKGSSFSDGKETLRFTTSIS